MVEAAVQDTDLPIALHLDHGADFEICKSCIDGGFTSVMIDGSARSFADNIAETKKVVEYAHERGVVVEAELGKLAGIEDDVNVTADDAQFTNPAETYTLMFGHAQTETHPYQKFGMVKYNAFKGMGGNLSFAIAILDMNNTGFILNSVHSREGCYLYIKMIERGETDILLGSEEKEALEQALGY